MNWNLVSFAGYRGKVPRPLARAALPQKVQWKGRPCTSLPIPTKREQEAGEDRAVLLLALSRCSPPLLLVYPPTVSLGKVRSDGLSRAFSISAKFFSMGNFKSRLTAVGTDQLGRTLAKTTRRKCTGVPGVPGGRAVLAYPGLSLAYPGDSCLPCTCPAP